MSDWYEEHVDFTTCTEIDPDDELTIVDSGEFDILDQNFDASSRLYKDYGAGFFDSDFYHEFMFEVDLGDSYHCGLLAMSNTPNGYTDFSEEDVYLSIVPGHTSLWFKLNIATSLGGLSDESIELMRGALYQVQVSRYGSEYQVYILLEGGIVDILYIDPGVVTAFQYLYIQHELVL
jgi:hypothetical protein